MTLHLGCYLWFSLCACLCNSLSCTDSSGSFVNCCPCPSPWNLPKLFISCFILLLIQSKGHHLFEGCVCALARVDTDVCISRQCIINPVECYSVEPWLEWRGHRGEIKIKIMNDVHLQQVFLSRDKTDFIKVFTWLTSYQWLQGRAQSTDSVMLLS